MKIGAALAAVKPFGNAYESPQSAEGLTHVVALDEVSTSTTRKLSAPPTVPNVAWFESGTFDLSSSAGATYGHWPNSVQGGSNAAFCCGYMSEVSQSGHGADSVVRALHGEWRDNIDFGDIIKTEFTICSVTRYTHASGPSLRILTSEQPPNWLHGHWGSYAGMAYYGDGFKTAQDYAMQHNTDWLVMCGTNAGSQLKLVNGATKGTATGGQGGEKLVVNRGYFATVTHGDERSNFAIAEVMVWDRGLTSEEMYGVSDHLMIKFGVGGMTASPTHTPTSSPIKTDAPVTQSPTGSPSTSPTLSPTTQSFVSSQSADSSATSITSMYYPDWSKSKGGCKTGGGQPMFMTLAPSTWMFRTRNDCCSRYFGWMLTECTGTPGVSLRGLWFPDWKRGDETCKNDGSEPAYMAMNPGSWMFSTQLECCKENFGWKLDTCLGSSDPNAGATNKWYMVWDAYKCQQDCVGSGPSCGGRAASWDELFETRAACCADKAAWNPIDCLVD